MLSQREGGKDSGNCILFVKKEEVSVFVCKVAICRRVSKRMKQHVSIDLFMAWLLIIYITPINNLEAQLLPRSLKIGCHTGSHTPTCNCVFVHASIFTLWTGNNLHLIIHTCKHRLCTEVAFYLNDHHRIEGIITLQS